MIGGQPGLNPYPSSNPDNQIVYFQVSIEFPLHGGSQYSFTLDPLFAPIDPSSSKVSVMSTKIEVTLRKKGFISYDIINLLLFTSRRATIY